MKTFEARTALVTGASSGIGRAIALALADEGAGLCLSGRDPERLEAVATAARQRGVEVLVHAADLTDDSEIVRLARRLEEGPGGPDILVHSLGRFSSGATESTPVAELDALYRTNVRSVYLLTQALLPALRAGSAGQIVFVSSSIVAGARGGVGGYAASKAAMKALADSLRDEVNPQGIRVLSVHPGRTATPLQAAIFESEGRAFEAERLLQPEDVARIVVAALELPRTAEVTDIHIRPMNKI